MEDDVVMFWKRIDGILEDQCKDYKFVAEQMKVPYPTLIGWRYRGRYPKTEDMILMAKCLKASLDFLLTGKEAEPFSDEALAVDHDERLKAIVRACLRDEHYLLLVSSSIMTTEANASKEIFV